MKELFYCYSNRLHLFLSVFGVEYINQGINSVNNHKYYVYEKTEKLNILLTEWNKIKSLVDLNSVVRKER